MNVLAVDGGKLVARCRRLISWRAMLLAAVAIMGLLQLTPWIGATSQSKPSMSASCEPWDREASQAIAGLLPDTSAAAAQRLDDAILQLRRARKLCGAGALILAEHEYASLQRALARSIGWIGSEAAQARGRLTLPED
jgi:hypothetical protein